MRRAGEGESGPRSGALLFLAALAFSSPVSSCAPSRETGTGAHLSILVPAAERGLWQGLARLFESRAAGARVNVVEGPNGTDLRENLYTASLLARDETFDLVLMDVTWTPKLAGAGWLHPMDDLLSSAELGALLPPSVEAGRYAGRLYRIPVRTDVGLLFYRSDLLASAGLSPPRTLGEVRSVAATLQRPPELWGYLFQGAQYEGLVCVYLEALAAFGGFWIDTKSRRVGLDEPEALQALRFLSSCRSPGPAEGSAITPAGVTAMREDEARRLFQDGRAVLMRSWPYVHRLSQAPSSAVAGKVGATVVAGHEGRPGRGTLGGWGLGVSRFSRQASLARDFIRLAISLEGQRALCERSGYAPALMAAYDDEVLLRANPFLTDLRRLNARTVARPAVARYALVSDVLQRQLSAALSGLIEPGAALATAARQTRRALGEGPW